MAKIESRYYTADDVAKMIGCSKGTAYKIIRDLNTKWEQQGKIAVRGKVNKIIFNEFFPQ